MAVTLAQGAGHGSAFLSGSTGLRRTLRGGYESPGKLIGWAGLVQGSLTLLAASALLLDHAMSSLDFVVVGRSGSLQLLVVYLTLVTFKAEGEDAVVAAALLVLLPALTPPSPLRCRDALHDSRKGLPGATQLGGFAKQLGTLVPDRFAIVLFAAAAVFADFVVILVVAKRHGSGFAPIVGRHRHRRLSPLSM